ncbi:acyl carrier protein [Kineosporia rhizophila]|uniref:acyl carrier protein n=1 Tax=Kineosporia TaxID=49184 RepID=UPI001E505C6A|nr:MULTISPECIES: acyl carrier protein [Kineosporia]MCE0537628.1 acyl carrier protein [Kineosporia rhizophila]GLY18857.1 actinorhodin polyketide synthase acyl carrier protein [Kineosporia sp. NBRC 101677]
MADQITMADVKQALLEGSGVQDGVDLDRDLLGSSFRELGYDSLAVLETGLRLGRDNSIKIDDEVFTDLETPQQLLDAVNLALAGRKVAS